MKNTNTNINLSAELSDYALALARNTFKNPSEWFYDLDFSTEILNKLLSSVDYFDGNLIRNTSHDLSKSKDKIIQDYFIYVIKSEKIILSFKKILDHQEDGTSIEKITDIFFFYEEDENTIELIKKFTSDFNNYLYKKDEVPYFYTISSGHFGYDLSYNKLKDINYTDKHIKSHYNDGFFDEYKSIVKNLKEETHGLILLHGEPGTGKSSILRQIIGQVCKDKEVIYVPSFMMENFANPEFISFISDHDNSILVLEDAEAILSKRSGGGSSQGVSNILNMTNGLLNESMKIQIIATFNMTKTKLDEALLRPGRLINEWEFKKLPTERCNKLLKEIGKDYITDVEMAVSEIYDLETYLKTKNVKRNPKKEFGI